MNPTTEFEIVFVKFAEIVQAAKPDEADAEELEEIDELRRAAYENDEPEPVSLTVS